MSSEKLRIAANELLCAEQVLEQLERYLKTYQDRKTPVEVRLSWAHGAACVGYDQMQTAVQKLVGETMDHFVSNVMRMARERAQEAREALYVEAVRHHEQMTRLTKLNDA